MAGVNTFEVLSPGIMSTVQDLGRFGCARYGVAASGALDGFAVRVGNLLVGNPENAAVVETTLMGLRIKAVRDAVVAVTGGDLQARKGSEPLAVWRSHLGAGRGDHLFFGTRERFALLPCRRPAASTLRRSWAAGRPTWPQDSAASRAARCARETSSPCEPVKDALRFAGRAFTAEWIPDYPSPWRLRIVWGPQDDHFSEEGRQTFVTAAFTVSPDSDRTGIRLNGPV